MSKKPSATEAEILALSTLAERNNLLRSKSVSEQLLEKHFAKFSGNVIAKYQDVSESFILRHGPQMDWKMVCKYQKNKLATQTIVSFANAIYWKYVIKYQTVPESIIEKFMKPGALTTQTIDLRLVAKYQTLSSIFVQNHWNELDHDIITQYQTLPEFIIHKYANDLNWPLVCRYQKLSEPFMYSHHDKLIWSKVLLYQTFNQQFLKTFIEKFLWEFVLCNRNNKVEPDVVTIPPEIDADDPEVPLV